MNQYAVTLTMSYELTYTVEADCADDAEQEAIQRHEESFNDAGCYYWPVDADDLDVKYVEEL